MNVPWRDGAQPSPDNGEGEQPIIRDKRRLDPETGMPREHVPDGGGAGAAPAGAGAAAEHAGFSTPDPQLDALRADLVAAQSEAAERTEDLQRLQAEYVNYRKRVDRDRELAGEQGVRKVIDALIPALDDIQAAREFGQLDGPLKALADKIEEALGKFGWERYGAIADPFDPTVHEALTVHAPAPEQAQAVERTHAETGGPAITLVMQPGHKVGEYVLRPARVGVSEFEPTGTPAPAAPAAGDAPEAAAPTAGEPPAGGEAPPSADE